jgi:hypothetical protein
MATNGAIPVASVEAWAWAVRDGVDVPDGSRAKVGASSTSTRSALWRIRIIPASDPEAVSAPAAPRCGL